MKFQKKHFRAAEEMVNQIGIYFINSVSRRIAKDQLIYNKESFVSEAGYHHIGGTRMGDNKNISVVDKNLKVHETNNLYVCGSSTFVSGGHANPTLNYYSIFS